jgi:hypothetical protein
MLDVAQVFAWGRMFAGYARSESFVKAANETFDPAKPCAICLAVCKAREASTNHSQGVPTRGTDKMVLIFTRPMDIISPDVAEAWPVYRRDVVAAPSSDVPVPPPRGTELRFAA